VSYGRRRRLGIRGFNTKRRSILASHSGVIRKVTRAAGGRERDGERPLIGHGHSGVAMKGKERKNGEGNGRRGRRGRESRRGREKEQ
jgi:hypothetical protein